MSEDVPEALIIVEQHLMEAGSNSPMLCMPDDDERSDEEILRAFEEELQYHMGQFNAVMHLHRHMCKELGYSERQYMDHWSPWYGDAIDELTRLREVVDE